MRKGKRWTALLLALVLCLSVLPAGFTKSVEDQELTPEEYPKWMEEMAGGAVYQILRRPAEGELPYEYEIYLDANERTYLAKVYAKHDVEVWERFMNR